VIVVGAGIGGLAAAVSLAARGVAVRVIERDADVGGKLRPVVIGDQVLDAGPTVFTMRRVFDELFASAGQALDDHLRLSPLQTLARHQWRDGSQLDLYAELPATIDAIGRFAGARAADQYQQFCRRSQRTFDTLERPYLHASRPNPLLLAWRCGWRGLPGLMRISPFETLWQALGRQFDDPRLRQLFARYATYGGSSPMSAPATLMLIAHVERIGVWSVDGGMYRIADAVRRLAMSLGVRFEFGRRVERLLIQGGRVGGVALDGGETQAADAVVFNGDPQALAQGLLGDAFRTAAPTLAKGRRSLSALTWNLRTPARGFPLLRHTVFFSGDYRAEFDDLFANRRLPTDPTVYVCAQDRGDAAPDDTYTPERLLCLVNAPPQDDDRLLSNEEIEACESRTFRRLADAGLALAPASPGRWRHAPIDWATRFPGTGGALYGQATHGWRASFSRPSSSSRWPGLYLAGGSTHPGAGVPMAALSGLLAAQRCLADHAGRTSISTWRPAAMPGGTSTR
jgi:1-hydroxycarotenoid 3,4-desaturase